MTKLSMILLLSALLFTSTLADTNFLDDLPDDNLQQAPFSPPQYDQFDPQWATEVLGNGPRTLKQSGCLISSLASMMVGDGLNLPDGTVPTPSTLNKWLKENKGFQRSDFVWTGVNPLGIKFIGKMTDTAQIYKLWGDGKRIILHINGGSHWVLLRGTNCLGLLVMDPGHKKSIVAFKDVVKYAVFSTK